MSASARQRLALWAKRHSNVTPLDGTDRNSPTFGDLRALLASATGHNPLQAAMAQLYAAEINCGITSFWDAGWTAWIGDEINGRKAEETFWGEDLVDVAEWLLREAEAQYPGFKRATTGSWINVTLSIPPTPREP